MRLSSLSAQTGFDPNLAEGLVVDYLANGNNEQTWTSPLNPDNEISFNDAGKTRTLFVMHGVPTNFPFEPVARKEVSEVKFHKVSE